MPSWCRLFWQVMRAAASRTFWTAGKSRPIRIAMIAMTTSSSISVKPRRCFCRERDMDSPPNQRRETTRMKIVAGGRRRQSVRFLQFKRGQFVGAGLDLGRQAGLLRVRVAALELVGGRRDALLQLVGRCRLALRQPDDADAVLAGRGA